MKECKHIDHSSISAKQEFRTDRRAFLRQFVAATLLCFSVSNAAVGQGADLDDVKAAFLFQFLNYVVWPEDSFETPRSPIVICVVGNEKVYKNLVGSVKGRKIGEREIEILNHSQDKEPETCHILFIDGKESDAIAGHLKNVSNKAVLTVSDSPEFMRQGGMIRLFIKKTKPKIEIHRETTEEAKLKVSSKLLKVSEIYQD